MIETPYHAADDPRNAAPGGFELARERAPDDPGDAAKRRFSIETLYQLKSIGAPEWSPDGARALFTVTRHELARGTSNSDIYMLLRGGDEGPKVRQLTRHDGADGHPRWAPDGRSFLFTSDRSGKTQIWRMSLDGGEPEQLSDIPTGVADPEWAGSGRVVFTARVFPEYGADFGKTADALKDRESSPTQAHVMDDLLGRHWNFYKDGRRRHIFALELASGATWDLTPGDFDSPAFDTGGGGFAISPDGLELCYASNREPGSARAWTTNKDLFVTAIERDADHAAPINLTGVNRAYDGDPAYSPDGRYIAFRRQEVPGYESDRFRLAVYDRAGGVVKVLTEGFDNWVLEARWAPDSASLVFKAAERGRTPLFRVALESGEARRLALPSARDYDVAADGTLGFSFTRVGEPVELFIAEPDGGDVRRVTGLNQTIANTVDIRPAEELWIEGAGGRTIHTFVVKPHGYKPGQRYPLILNVHGGPQSHWHDALRGDWQVYPGSGYVVAFANPHGSIGYGQEFTDGIKQDWGGKVYEDLMAVTEHLSAQPYVDPARVGAMGWSYGGYMMNWMLGHTERFKAIASMMGIYDLRSFYGATEELWFAEADFGGPPWEGSEAYASWSPSARASEFKTPTLVITGERDYRVPYTQSLQLFTALRRQGVPARLIVFPDDGHWPSNVKSMPLYYAAHLDWFHRYLGGEPSLYAIEDILRGRAFKKSGG
ncbi:MAG: S9 family peptidase [Myxococcales bacterium]|nr:S9 family peptidase [Myxococcales bacterium]